MTNTSENLDTDFIIRNLVDSFENDDIGDTTRSMTVESKFQTFIPVLMKDVCITTKSMRCSSATIKREMISLLSKLKSDDDPAESFYEGIGEIKSKLKEKKTKEYVVAFPLNIDFESDGLDTLVSFDNTFFRIAEEEWKESYVPDYEGIDPESVLKINEEISKESDHRDVMLLQIAESVEESPNALTEPHYTYWTSSCWARESQYALNHTWRAINNVLSRINFSYFYNKTNRKFGHQGIWPSRWADLREPYISFVYKDGDLVKYGTSKDPTLREPFVIEERNDEQFHELFSEIPNFQEEEKVDEDIVDSLSHFQSGITNPDYTNAFFDFWRAIEVLAQTNQNHTTNDVMDRAQSHLKWSEPKVKEQRTKILLNRRNKHVHEGLNESSSVHERNFLKMIFEKMFVLYMSKRTEWSESDFSLVLSKGGASREALQRSINQREREVEVLNQFLEMLTDDD